MAIFVLVLCFSLILLWNALKFLHATWWRPKMLEWKLKRQGIYGPAFNFLYGNAKEMIQLTRDGRSRPMKLSHDIVTRVDPFLQKQTLSYGKAFVVWYGTTPRVNIMDPKLIREILSRALDFHKPEVHWSMKLFLSGLANIDGEKWVRHRKIINPAFHTEKLKRMLPAFMICCQELVEKWNKSLNASGSCELDVCEVDVFADFQELTGDVIARTAFGSNLEEGRQIFTLQREQTKYFLLSLYHCNYPWSRFLPTKMNKRMKQIHKEVGQLLGEMIDNREKDIRSGKTQNDDLLTILLRSNINKKGEDRNQSNLGMTREDMIEEIKLFLFAGHETTANLLTWSMVALSMHQDWQEKARNEVLEVLGKSKPTFDDLSRLKTVNMILLEVLRLYPPVSLVRCTYKETKIGEYSLPNGVSLQIPLYILQRDPELWGEDATEFNPKRFADGLSQASKDQVSFFSFGWGPRICVGQQFALLEATLALSLILQQFSFELSPSYAHAPTVILTLQPQFGAQIILRTV